MSAKRLSLYLLVASLCVSGLLGIIALIVGDFGDLEIRILLTSLTVSGGSLLALCGGAALEKRAHSKLGMGAIAFAAVGVVLLLIGIWAEIGEDNYWRTVASVWTIAVSFALLSLVTLARLEARFQWAMRGEFFLVALLTLLLLTLYWADFEVEWYMRLLGSVSILFTFFTLLIPILVKVGQIGEPTTQGAPATVPQLCPQCGTRVEAPLGRVACLSCGTVFEVSMHRRSPVDR